MSLEDAVVLGELFRHLSSEEQIPTFLYAYEELRMERTKQVKERDVSNAVYLRLPPGRARDERNASVRHGRDEWDDGSLKTEFEGLAMLFAYDAYDAAAVRISLPNTLADILKLTLDRNGGCYGADTTLRMEPLDERRKSSLNSHHRP